jgi:DNA-binding LacI/PurR family transcriptional regulator
MEVAARAQGFFVVTCGIDPSDPQSVNECVEHLMKLGIEGLVLIAPQIEALDAVRKLVVGIPVVTMDSMYRMDELAVSVDNFSGGVSATQHLLDLGHRNVVHISGPKNWFESTARSAGYTATMLGAGLTPRIIEGDWELKTGDRIGRKIDLNSKGATGVFLANDRMAIGFLHAMRERGISVPEQLSVVGFDDVAEAAYSSPPLTTLRQDFKELGSRAMSLLLDEISSKGVKKLERLVPELIIRRSSGPSLDPQAN